MAHQPILPRAGSGVISHRVAVDTGGTFTDIVHVSTGGVSALKLLSTPADPSRAVLDGISQLGSDQALVVHGTTVATNALLERKGARTALITTEGFTDILALARQHRPDVYALTIQRPTPLVPPELCFGVAGRLGPDGSEERPLDEDRAVEFARALAEASVESATVCFLHSYANPDHERRFATRLRGALAALDASVDVTLSSEVNPEIREYERASTSVANAYVRPLMSRYLERLATSKQVEGLRIVLSNGGCVSAHRAAQVPIHTALSGPAAGVMGALACATRAGFDRILTFDMGGTSTDVALCDGVPPMARDLTAAGLPLRIASLDIHTVGAGGGSLGWVDRGGALHAGPRSAGAAPGPACYGLGGHEATVTDADLVRGHLVADRFLGGSMQLDEDAAHRAVEALGRKLSATAERAAAGLARVANAVMERALKVISVARGKDPRGFSLLCFGGAGGMHACELAHALRIQRVIVPPHPGVLSALGMLFADTRFDFGVTVFARLTGKNSTIGARVATEAFSALTARAEGVLEEERIAPRMRRVVLTAAVRYAGQSFELEVPWRRGPAKEAAADAAAAFHAAHATRYGFSLPDEEVELVAARAGAIGLAAPPSLPRAAMRSHDAAPTGKTRHGHALFDRDALEPGAHFLGPAIVTEYSATTFIPPGWRATVHESFALLVEHMA